MRSKFQTITLCFLAALAFILVPAAGLAMDKPDDPAAKAVPVEVQQLVFDTVDAAVPIEQLPAGVRELAQAIASQSPGATFKFTDGTLTVQVHDVRGKINPLSDCPNNTQFNVDLVKAKERDKLIEAVTVAWTRLRHRAPDATILAINIRESEKGKNYDVQLNLPPQLSRLE